MLESPAIVDGSELRDASAYSRTGSDSDYQICFFAKARRRSRNLAIGPERTSVIIMAVVLNDEVKSAAFIKSTDLRQR